MGAQGTSAIVHLGEVWKDQFRHGDTFEEATVHATANVINSALVWGIRRLIFVGVAGPRPRDPDPYLDARGRAEELVRGSDRSWTVFRSAPWYDLRAWKAAGLPAYSKELAEAIAESVYRQDTVGRVYEERSTDRFPWEGTLPKRLDPERPVSPVTAPHGADHAPADPVTAPRRPFH